MGGHIGVNSTPGTGSTFWLELPLTSVGDEPGTTQEDPKETIAGKRVLVVDDHPVNRRIFAKQLASLEVAVELAEDAKHALQILEKEPDSGFDALIIDHMMPEVSGEALASIIRSDPRWRTLKMVLSSSGALNSDQAARALGFDGALPKPIRLSAMLRCLAKLFGASLAAEGERVGTRTEPAAQEQKSGVRVLVVEDNHVNQLLATSILRKAGHRVDVAGNGIEALEAVDRQPYDIVLMDVQMPEMDGLTATRKIRSGNSRAVSVPILAMTANAMKGDREHCLQAGMNDYVTKPIDRALLLEKIDYWTRGESSGDALDAEVAEQTGSDSDAALSDLLDSLDSVETKVS